MKRRDFLIRALATGALYSSTGLPGLIRTASANGFATLNHRVLVNVTLDGGPDFRHLFPPAFNSNPASFGYRYWAARADAHTVDNSASALAARWSADYDEAGDGQTSFGILSQCGWLKDMWDAGNVAVVNNVVGAQSRDHAHSQLVLDQGNRSSGPNDFGRSGWGGRLASAAGGNVLSLTRRPRPFCYGPHPTDPYSYDNANVVAAADSRKIRLFSSDGEPASSNRARITRSLESYYAAKRTEIAPDSIYARFFQHEQILREVGGPLDDRLQGIPVPASIAALEDGGLNEWYIGRQIRNLYDTLAASDILNVRVASLEVLNWDSHRLQREMIEPKFEDLFGRGKALDTLISELPPSVSDNLVFVLSGEFGRQLVANGDYGTDHGAANTMLVIGNSVTGGIYGDMFPEAELGRIDMPSADIEGLTEFDHVYGAVCDFVAAGSGNTVFPQRQNALLETGVDLGQLFG